MVNLQGNSIVSFDPMDIHGIRIEDLDLSYNNFANLTSKQFQSFNKL